MFPLAFRLSDRHFGQKDAEVSEKWMIAWLKID